MDIQNEKVYVAFKGRRDGSWGTTNEFEEEIWKISLSEQKIIDLIMLETDATQDEEGYFKFNLEEHPHNDHEDTDYEYFRLEEHDLEKE